MAAYKFLEGFDHWASIADGTGKGWTITSFDGGPAISFAAGRFGGQALDGHAYPQRLSKALLSNQTTLYLGAAFSSDSAFPGQPDERGNLFAVSTGGTIQVALKAGVKTLAIVDSSGATTTINGFTMPAAGTWTYLEIGVVAGSSSSTGSISVRQDGAQLGSFNVPTVTASASAYDAAMYYAPDCENAAGRIDDIYLSNGQGIDTSFCGPLQVVTVYPTADIGTSSWTPSSGTALFSQVNEAQEDGATSTISTTINAAEADFAFSSLSGTLGTIVGVQSVITGIGSGGSTIAGKISSNGTVHVGPYANLAATYTAYAPECLELDPATAERWTAAGFAAATKGIVKGSP